MRNIPHTSMLFIERLSLCVFLFDVLPLQMRRSAGRPFEINYVDASSGGLLLARMICRFMGGKVSKLNFRLIDIKDDEGQLVRLKIMYEDMVEFQRNVVKSDVFQSALSKNFIDQYMASYLMKQVVDMGRQKTDLIWRAFVMIQAAAWFRKRRGVAADYPVLFFVGNRDWFCHIKDYGKRYNVHLIQTKFQFKLVEFGPYVTKIVLFMLHCINKLKRKTYDSVFGEPKIAALSYCNFNIEKKDMYSDLFFLQQSNLRGEDILLIFFSMADPANFERVELMKRYGVHPVAISRRAKQDSRVSHYKPNFYLGKSYGSCFNDMDRKTAKWFIENLKAYDIRYSYWVNFVKKYNVKMFVSWYKYDADHCVLASALNNTGGVTAIYQRAFEDYKPANTLMHSDISFGFSRYGYELERRSESCIPYYVITGYLGDFRFALNRSFAANIRTKLVSAGASRIISFFDENSVSEERWYLGNDIMKESYEFLLKKVINEKWLGLILKPKKFSTLRERLGAVSELFDQARKTGRCIVLEEGPMHNLYPPSTAALASDVAIHGHLFASTAGVEAALAGIPTILMDKEGWSKSMMYKLGVGNVVFTDWEALWDAFVRHMDGKYDGSFGDWSSMIDVFDPFRDGRAAERMGNYLSSILSGIKKGKDKFEVLEETAEKYRSEWGKETVLSVLRK